MNRMSVEPRLLTVEQAAAYLGYDCSDVLKNIPVKPVHLTEVGRGSGPRYDRKALDLWLDQLSGLTIPEGVVVADTRERSSEKIREEWKRRKATRSR